MRPKLYGYFKWEELSKEIQYNFKDLETLFEFLKSPNNCSLDE